MAIDIKYGHVHLEHTPDSMRDDEPVVVFRARDVALPGLLEDYIVACTAVGSPQAHVEQVRTARETVLNWQRLHGSKVPD